MLQLIVARICCESGIFARADVIAVQTMKILVGDSLHELHMCPACICWAPLAEELMMPKALLIS